MKDLRKTAEEIFDKSFNSEMSVKDATINAMLEMYHLYRPKVMVFDANDPKTFPNKVSEYCVKTPEGWDVDKWSECSKTWDDYYNHEVTHYAEILMPE